MTQADARILYDIIERSILMAKPGPQMEILRKGLRVLSRYVRESRPVTIDRIERSLFRGCYSRPNGEMVIVLRNRTRYICTGQLHWSAQALHGQFKLDENPEEVVFPAKGGEHG